MTGRDIHYAASLLKAGKLVAIPTETVYGLAARFDDDAAVTAIFEAKARPAFDPLIVHIGKLAWLDKLAMDIPFEARELIKSAWPGPVTVLLKKSELVSDLITSGHPTVAIRMPGHPLTLELLNLLGVPVAAPSANPFGYVSPTRADHVEKQLGEKVAYILDGGEARVGLESTIVSFVGPHPVVLRLGGMSMEELTEKMGILPEIRIATHSNPEAPGQMDAHYATLIPLVHTRNIRKEAAKHQDKALALLSYKETYSDISWVQKEVLSQKGNITEAAQKLFAAMRRLDEGEASLILAEYFPEEGLGRAINDRLHRASHRK